MPDQHLGLFVTLSAYGNRLHGDPRGSVDRYTNGYGEAQLEPNRARMLSERREMTHPPTVFNDVLHSAIEAAVLDACEFRGWEVYAMNCRTNHFHAVVATGASRKGVVPRLKDRATRAVRTAGLLEPGQPLWARGGSGRYLWDERDLEAACLYVLESQGEPLPGTRVWLDMA